MSLPAVPLVPAANNPQSVGHADAVVGGALSVGGGVSVVGGNLTVAGTASLGGATTLPQGTFQVSNIGAAFITDKFLNLQGTTSVWPSPQTPGAPLRSWDNPTLVPAGASTINMVGNKLFLQTASPATGTVITINPDPNGQAALGTYGIPYILGGLGASFQYYFNPVSDQLVISTNDTSTYAVIWL